MVVLFYAKLKTAYELRISDWSSDVCSSDLCSSYFSSNQAFRRAVSDCWSLVAAVAAAAAAVSGLAAGCLKATRANGRASARATARELRAKGVHKIGRVSCRDRVCQYG